jgi:hypothetical protein
VEPRIQLSKVVGTVTSLTCPSAGYCAATDTGAPDSVVVIDGASARIGRTGLGPANLRQPAVSCPAVGTCTLVLGTAAADSYRPVKAHGDGSAAAPIGLRRVNTIGGGLMRHHLPLFGRTLSTAACPCVASGFERSD